MVSLCNQINTHSTIGAQQRAITNAARKMLTFNQRVCVFFSNPFSEKLLGSTLGNSRIVATQITNAMIKKLKDNNEFKGNLNTINWRTALSEGVIGRGPQDAIAAARERNDEVIEETFIKAGYDSIIPAKALKAFSDPRLYLANAEIIVDDLEITSAVRFNQKSGLNLESEKQNKLERTSKDSSATSVAGSEYLGSLDNIFDDEIFGSGTEEHSERQKPNGVSDDKDFKFWMTKLEAASDQAGVPDTQDVTEQDTVAYPSEEFWHFGGGADAPDLTFKSAPPDTAADPSSEEYTNELVTQKVRIAIREAEAEAEAEEIASNR